MGVGASEIGFLFVQAIVDRFAAFFINKKLLGEDGQMNLNSAVQACEIP
jgi:hypothetical protein